MTSLFSIDLLGLLLEQCNEEAKTIIVKSNLQSVVDKSSNTLLHYAATWNNAAITQYLLDSGNQVNVQNHLGKTPLMLAVENGSCDTVEILIKAGASVLIEDKLTNNVLEMVGASNWLCHEEGIMRILLRNSDISKIANKLLEYGWPLTRVMLFRNVELTTLLLDRGHKNDVDETDSEFSGATALHVATKIFDVENVKLLLTYNADIDAKDNDDQNPISYVFEGDLSEHADERLEILKVFIEHTEGDDWMRYQGVIDESVSHILEDGSKEAVKLLVEAGYDFEIVEDDGTYNDSPIHLIARNKNPGVIKEIRDVFPNVDACNNEMETPLIIAASHGIPDTVIFLIDHGADVDAMDYTYTTPLSAAIRNCKECVQILLEHGADAQLVYSLYSDDDRRTILHDILEFKQFENVELVLSHLALAEARGKTVKQLLRSKIDSHERLRSDFESSQRELTIKVHESITVFDLLTASEKKFECYVRNEELYSKLKIFGETCKMYYFKTILQKRLSQVEIKKKSVRVICGFMKMDYERFPLIADQIVSYLKPKDMKNLLYTISNE